MAITTWPLDAVSGAPAYTGRMLRTAMMGPALGGATPARPLGARSGVRPGTDVSISVTATSSTVTVGAMAGVLDVLPSALTGPYGWAITAAESKSLAAAHASYTRWDGVAIALDDPAEAAGTVPESRIVLVTGTASSNPVMPVLPAHSMWLARVVVPRSGQGVPAVVDIAPRCGSADGVPHFGTVADRDAILPVPWVGQVCTTGSGAGYATWAWTGSRWSVALSQGQGTVFAGWSGYVRWQQMGRMVTAEMAVTRTDGEFTISAWLGVAFADGLPPARKPMLMTHLVTNISSDANAFAPSVNTTGIVYINAIWSDRLVSQGGWLSGSFSYEVSDW